MGKLDGKVAVVTGASSGIGLATAKALGAEGAAVVLAGRTMEPMEAAAKAISSDTGQASVKQTDVRDEKQVIALADHAVATFGQLDIWVNNAGYNPFDNILDGDYAKWRETLEVNVLGYALGCREAYRAMKGQGSGHIVNINSVASRNAEPDDPMYAASKHAADALTESLRIQLEGKGIRMTAIMPGAVATNLVRSMPQETLFGIGRMLGQNPDEWDWKPGDRLPQQLLDQVAAMAKNFVMSPEDVAEAVLFAVSTPATVHVNEIMLRPPQALQMPGLRLPA
jgi:NADP-dependent 3-hydroxy acid dehydrogenase YdfG